MVCEKYIINGGHMERKEYHLKNWNQIILMVCISLLLLCSLITAYLQISMRLKYPHFLRYHWEIGMPSSDSTPVTTEKLILRYITNANDDSHIRKIIFEEAPELEAYVTEAPNYLYLFDTSVPNDTVYGSYKLKAVCVVFNYTTIKDTENSLYLENAEITLSDGRVFQTNLGTITMYPKLEMFTMTPEDLNQSFDSYYDILCYLYSKKGVVR